VILIRRKIDLTGLEDGDFTMSGVTNSGEHVPTPMSDGEANKEKPVRQMKHSVKLSKYKGLGDPETLALPSCLDN
jgi:hypothetical protein